MSNIQAILYQNSLNILISQSFENSMLIPLVRFEIEFFEFLMMMMVGSYMLISHVCSYLFFIWPFVVLLSFTFGFLVAVIAVDLKQTVQVDKDLQIRAYYAGHVRFLDLTSTAFPTLTAMFAQLMMNIFLFNPLHCQVSPHAGFVIILILRFCCLHDVKNVSLALFSGHVTPLATA